MSKLFSQMDAVCHRFEELSVRLNQPKQRRTRHCFAA